MRARFGHSNQARVLSPQVFEGELGGAPQVSLGGELPHHLIHGHGAGRAALHLSLSSHTLTCTITYTGACEHEASQPKKHYDAVYDP